MKKLLSIPCTRATYLVSQKEEGKLNLINRLRLAIHLTACAVCSLFEKQNTTIVQNTLKLHEHITETLPIEKKETIKTTLNNEINNP